MGDITGNNRYGDGSAAYGLQRNRGGQGSRGSRGRDLCGNFCGRTVGDKTGDAAAGAAGEGQITFTFAEHVANIEQQAPQVYGVVQEYMKLHPNVTIELTGASADDLTRNIQMAAQSNTLPDLFWIRQPVAVEMAKAGYLADLSEDILNDRELTDTFLPHVLDSLKIDGKLYGIPCELQSNGFWVNKMCIRDRGVPAQRPPPDSLPCEGAAKG